MIQCAKDLSRSIDYLETRQDIDSHKLAYYGLSRGAGDAIVTVAIENRRLKTSLLIVRRPGARVASPGDRPV